MPWSCDRYERSYPVTGCNEDYTKGCQIAHDYHNAPHTVHIVNGAGGDTEGIDPTWVGRLKVPFRAAHSEGLHTGYARVLVNQTALDWSYVYSGSDAVPGDTTHALHACCPYCLLSVLFVAVVNCCPYYVLLPYCLLPLSLVVLAMAIAFEN